MKYYKFNYQIGGDVINRRTQEKNEFERARTINQLTELNVNCEDTHGINSFHLLRNIGNEHLYYDYNCINNANPKPTQENRNTSDYYGTGQNIYLDKHNIDCNNRPITQINLLRPNKSTLEYHYKCGNTQLRDIQNYDTGFNDYGDGENIYLDRHNVRCPDESILTQIRLVRNPANTNEIRYNYRCGRVRVPIIIEIYRIPDRMIETQSWLYMPLIYNNLEDILVRFPDGFVQIFNESIQQYNSSEVGRDSGRLEAYGERINNFEDYNRAIKRRLNEEFHIRTRQDILNRTTDIYEDMNCHIPGGQQERILEINIRFQILLQFLVENFIARLQNREIIIENM